MTSILSPSSINHHNQDHSPIDKSKLNVDQNIYSLVDTDVYALAEELIELQVKLLELQVTVQSKQTNLIDRVYQRPIFCSDCKQNNEELSNIELLFYKRNRSRKTTPLYSDNQYQLDGPGTMWRGAWYHYNSTFPSPNFRYHRVIAKWFMLATTTYTLPPTHYYQNINAFRVLDAKYILADLHYAKPLQKRYLADRQVQFIKFLLNSLTVLVTDSTNILKNKNAAEELSEELYKYHTSTSSCVADGTWVHLALFEAKAIRAEITEILQTKIVIPLPPLNGLPVAESEKKHKQPLQTSQQLDDNEGQQPG